MGQPETQAPIVQQSLEQSVGKQVFYEDLTPEQRAQFYKNVLKEVLPVGLVNLGNTCYLNSTMQVLHQIPELKQTVNTTTITTPGVHGHLVKQMKVLFNQLENAGEAIEPRQFLLAFFAAFPQFSERDEDMKSYRQQDADECFQALLNEIEPTLKANAGDIIQKLFEIQFKIITRNKEASEEEPVIAFENARKLTCIIDNQMNPVNNLSEGIKVALEDTITKFSESLGRNAEFFRRAQLLTLPPYLLVQKIRFVWREKDAGTNTEARKAKILRNVAYPKILDVIEFCADELKEQLLPNRNIEAEQIEQEKKDAQEAYETYKKENQKEGEDNYKLYRAFKEEQKRKDDLAHDKRLWGDHSAGKMTGNYELVGVITHKGRSSDSGHYVAWLQHKGDTWMKYDDDEVTKVGIDDVMNLRGGGDWHMAYYLMYRRLDFYPN